MDNILTFSTADLLPNLLRATVVAVVVLLALGWRKPVLARIALRNVPRRRMRTILIVFGLMLSTMFIAASLAVDDTITTAVKSVAIFNLGRIDEDVTGGRGTLELYGAANGTAVAQALTGDRNIAGIAPALVVPNLLVLDATTREARGSATAFAIVPDAAGPLGELRTTTGQPAPISQLQPGEVYLSSTSGSLLFAHPGDSVTLASTYWLGQRQIFRVRAIVQGGLLGDKPAVVLPLATLQRLTGAGDQINHIYVANAGDGLSGVNYSETARDEIHQALLERHHVSVVKLDGVNFALNAQRLFGRILTLYTLFALAIGLLLIFLIFVLLAAERRAELGTVRAIGLRRSGVISLLLFEGAVYDLAAAALGIVGGLLLGIVIVGIVAPTIARVGYPLHFVLNFQSVILAFCLGLLFTLATIWLAAWTVSRITIAAAIRDMEEPPAPAPSLGMLLQQIGASIWRLPRQPWAPFAALLQFISALVSRGIIPALLGWYLLRRSSLLGDALIFSLGLSLLVAGGVLLLRWLVLTSTAAIFAEAADLLAIARIRRGVDRVTAALIGGGLALYWALPFDALAILGLPRFAGAGIQIFFIAGVMMVFGAVWAIAPNLDLLLAPLRTALAGIKRVRHVVRIALVYPAHQRFRTGIGLSLFTLVCFTMVVMACIAASTTRGFDNLPAQAASYDIVGQPLITPVNGIAALQGILRQHGGPTSGNLANVSSATPLLLGVLQPGASNARWHIYPASQMQGAFLDGVGLPLAARAQGFANDARVWQAVRDQPGSVVIDAGALSDADAAILGIHRPAQPDVPQFFAPPIVASVPGFASQRPVGDGSPASTDQQQEFAKIGELAQGDPDAVLELEHIAVGPGVIAPTALWVQDPRTNQAIKLHIVGVVDNVRGQRYGLFGSPQTFAPVEGSFAPFGNEYYYFQLKAGVNVQQATQTLGSSLFDYGFETTVIQDALLDANGPKVFISRVLVGLVGLTLLVGMAALAVTGSRAVVERRQQIGMLRALGFRRWQVQAIFLIESLLVGALGAGMGLALGLVLCQNIFAVDFFEPIQSGLILVIPWAELGVICIAALVAAGLAAVLPAWQAGRVTPADALRYE